MVRLTVCTNWSGEVNGGASHIHAHSVHVALERRVHSHLVSVVRYPSGVFIQILVVPPHSLLCPRPSHMPHRHAPVDALHITPCFASMRPHHTTPQVHSPSPPTHSHIRLRHHVSTSPGGGWPLVVCGGSGGRGGGRSRPACVPCVVCEPKATPTPAQFSQQPPQTRQAAPGMRGGVGGVLALY